MPHRVTPRNLVLDVFRVAPEATPAPIAALVDLGRMFGFEPTTMRTAVSRLTSAGLLESDARGWYRPAATTDPFRAVIEGWRRGEARMRRWKGEWLAVSCAPWPRRAAQRQTERALRYVGLRPAVARLWIRPDNLTASHAELRARLEAVGATQIDELFVARGFSRERIARWLRELWDVPQLEATYRATHAELGRSLARLETLPLERALVETFVYGGNAIRVLALDPLLPAELIRADLRRALTERMSEYERVGRRRWQERLDATPFVARALH
jgi:phenylacetic acid degradation operon negative regulatory protein